MQAFYQMAAVFEPPLNTRQKFAVRWKGDGESVLAYQSALLVLATAGFPKIDHDGLDALVLEDVGTHQRPPYCAPRRGRRGLFAQNCQMHKGAADPTT